MAFLFDLSAIMSLKSIILLQVKGHIFQHWALIPSKKLFLITSTFSSFDTFRNFLTIYFSYFFISALLANGKTLGKLIFDLEVQSLDQRDFYFKKAFLRAAGHTICLLSGFSLYGISLFFKNLESVPDLMAKTITRPRETMDQEQFEKVIYLPERTTSPSREDEAA